MNLIFAYIQPVFDKEISINDFCLNGCEELTFRLYGV
jgi:hypothetical protein